MILPRNIHFDMFFLTGFLPSKIHPKGQDLRELYKTVTRLYWFFKTFCNGNPVNKISKFDISALYNYKIYDYFKIL
jgi:hypothetical protein